MSTYYYFHCDKCRLSGGCWTGQVWGYGNADLIDAFKFVMHHVRQCGEQHIGMHSQHAEDNWITTSYDTEGGERRQHLEDTADIFPLSNDWRFMSRWSKTLLPELKKLWVEAELADLEGPDS